MKLIISLIITYSLNSWGYFYISYVSIENASKVRNILMENYQIPSNLIRLVKQNNCNRSQIQGAIAHFCTNKKGELILLSFNKSMIENSLLIFKKSKEDL